MSLCESFVMNRRSAHNSSPYRMNRPSMRDSSSIRRTRREDSSTLPRLMNSVWRLLWLQDDGSSCCRSSAMFLLLLLSAPAEPLPPPRSSGKADGKETRREDDETSETEEEPTMPVGVTGCEVERKASTRTPLAPRKSTSAAEATNILSFIDCEGIATDDEKSDNDRLVLEGIADGAGWCETSVEEERYYTVEGITACWMGTAGTFVDVREGDTLTVNWKITFRFVVHVGGRMGASRNI